MKKILLFVSFFIITISFTNAYSGISIKNKYNSFLEKIEIYNNYKQIIILEKVDKKIRTKYLESNLSKKSIQNLKELEKLNLEKLNQIKNTSNNSKDDLPSYVKNILSQNVKYYEVKKDENYGFLEFTEDGKTKRIIFKNYSIVNNNNYTQLKNKNGIIIKLNDNYVFIENYEKEEKILYSDSKNLFKSYIDDSKNFIEENGSYYIFIFKESKYLKNSDGFYIKALLSLGIDPKETVLYNSDGKHYFVKDYKKEKIISKKIIENINNKDKILSYLSQDKKYFSSENMENSLDEIKKITKKITEGKNREEKIKEIYIWIVNNLDYPKTVDLSKKEIFSGIETFRNKSGVCEGYVKLMSYMLFFAGIENFEITRGNVLTAEDFPNIGHAWLRIGEYYYDPTFDDPINLEKNLEFSKFEYYKLPKDLFYTNRYDFGKLPESFKTMTLEQRNSIVNKKLLSLAEKYKNENYNLLKRQYFLSKNSLNSNEKIDIDTLKKIYNFYEGYEKDYTFIKNGEKYSIKKMSYYKIDDDNAKTALKQINYKTENTLFLKWNFPDGTYEYRLVYSYEK